MRVGLIGSALILVAAIVSVVYRSDTGAPAPSANAPGSPTPSAAPATAASNAPNDPAAPLMVPARVLETSFPTLDGQPRRLADYTGKVIVVNVWATWCGPCRVEIPHLVELAKEFKGRGVEVIGLTTEDPAKDTDKVRDFVKEFKINYPVGFANGEFALHLMQGRDVIPQAYVIGRGGRVHKHFVGFNAQSSPPQLRAAVEEAVAAE
jgi:thiol-disulfide isomerase/thioredoxin